MGVKIDNMEIYYPKDIVGNQHYVDKFGEDILNLMRHLGREDRHVIGNSGENSLTMAVKAVNSLIETGKVMAEDIDIIVFVSDSPEFLVPNNAVIVKELVGASKCNIAYDINNCCIGMITAIDNVSSYMQGNKEYKTAIVVGASSMSKAAKDDCPILGPCMGDGAAAVVLRNNDIGGVIKSVYHANGMNYSRMMYPACGLSDVGKATLVEDDKKLNWIPHDVSYFSDRWVDLINKLLTETDTRVEDIKHFLFSQFSHADIKDTLEKLNVDRTDSNYTFIADKYGYTGNTSPFFAMYEAIHEKRCSTGDKVIFCSVGAGYTMSAMLYEM